MLQPNDFSLLPCTKEDVLAIASRGHFCFPPFDPVKDDDPVSLDTFFCKVVPNEDEEHFSKTYKLVKNVKPNDILALASIANSGFSFGSYENKPANLQNTGYNEDFPSVMLLAFGVRVGSSMRTCPKGTSHSRGLRENRKGLHSERSFPSHGAS